jgi:hypothetical protein
MDSLEGLVEREVLGEVQKRTQMVWDKRESLERVGIHAEEERSGGGWSWDNRYTELMIGVR